MAHYFPIKSLTFSSIRHYMLLKLLQVDAALSDEVPSVRSAACRAIGVIACFPQVIQR